MKRTMIDPPSGWRYGFPRVLPEQTPDFDLRQWFLDCGYPEKGVDLAMSHSRMWEEETEKE